MKKLLTLFSIAITSIAMACGSGPIPWTMDYIAAINGNSICGIDYNEEENYIVGYWKNSEVPYVDSPITVTVGLFSSQSIKMSSNVDDSGEMVNNDVGTLGYSGPCKLQYRILPDGKWITVSTYTPYTADGVDAANNEVDIYKDGLKPKNYFGKNNINLKGVAKGTTIMIRLVSNNVYASSGDESNLCSDLLTTFTSNYGTTAYTLPSYGLYGEIYFSNPGSDDIGGGFYIHNTTTVIYTGNERVIR